MKVSRKRAPAYSHIVGSEDPAHEGPESRVERDQEEEEQTPEQRRRRERREGELHELVGEPVVAPPFLAVHPDPPAHELDDDGEDRHAQDEGGEVQVDLGDYPDREPRADVGEGPVRGLLLLLSPAGGREAGDRRGHEENRDETLEPGRPGVSRTHR